MQLIVSLPDTVDPGMVDQLMSAVHRMGGNAQPAPDEEAEMLDGMPEEMAPEGMAGPPPGPELPPGPALAGPGPTGPVGPPPMLRPDSAQMGARPRPPALR